MVCIKEKKKKIRTKEENHLNKSNVGKKLQIREKVKTRR